MKKRRIQVRKHRRRKRLGGSTIVKKHSRSIRRKQLNTNKPLDFQLLPYISEGNLIVEANSKFIEAHTTEEIEGWSIEVTPPISKDYWSLRVKLFNDQAILAFPKFGTIGIGFAVEESSENTNFPWYTDAEVIYNHIEENKKYAGITKAKAIKSIQLIQEMLEKLGFEEERLEKGEISRDHYWFGIFNPYFDKDTLMLYGVDDGDKHIEGLDESWKNKKDFSEDVKKAFQEKIKEIEIAIERHPSGTTTKVMDSCVRFPEPPLKAYMTLEEYQDQILREYNAFLRDGTKYTQTDNIKINTSKKIAALKEQLKFTDKCLKEPKPRDRDYLEIKNMQAINKLKEFENIYDDTLFDLT